MSRSARIGLAISIVFLVLIGVGYSQLEWVEKKIDEGYGEEARQNEFLAAELFLQEQGRSTETVTGMALLDNLPPPGDVLFLSASRESLSVRRRDALISWVRSGGALLIVAHDVYDAEAGSSEDPLLDELGIFLLGPDEEGATESEEEEEGEEERVAETDSSPPSEDEAAPDAEETAAVEERDSTPKTLFELLDTAREPELCWTDSEQLSVISTSSYGPISLELSGQNELAVTDEQLDDAYFSSRYQMLTMPFGEGRIVALTSIAPFRNQRVHCQDHAFFLRLPWESERRCGYFMIPTCPHSSSWRGANFRERPLGGSCSSCSSLRARLFVSELRGSKTKLRVENCASISKRASHFSFGRVVFRRSSNA